MNRITVRKSYLNPALNPLVEGAEFLVLEETSVPGSYISIDPTKRVFPRGRMLVRIEQATSSGSSRGMVRAQCACLSQDGETEGASTVHKVCTTEPNAIKGGRVAIGADGAITDTPEGAFFVADRLVSLLSNSATPNGANAVHGIVCVDGNKANDMTGLLDADATVRYSNPFVRLQNGLPAINVSLIGEKSLDSIVSAMDSNDA